MIPAHDYTICFDGWYAPGLINRDDHAAYLRDAGAHLIGLVEDANGWVGVLYFAEEPLVDWHVISESLAPTLSHMLDRETA